MATLEVLRDLVSTIIQDTSFTDAVIDGYINDGVTEIAHGMESSLGRVVTPPLPALFTIGTVATVTDAAYVSMPDGFQRDLRFVARSDGIEVDIANSMIQFSMDYPLMDGSGDVVDTIEYGGNLYYQGIPVVAETLTLHYFKAPTEMEDDDDEPDGIPIAFQKKLLVNYACKEIYGLIEDGIERQPINTIKFTGLFLSALKAFELSIPYDARSLNL